jgi:hypothetical protein
MFKLHVYHHQHSIICFMRSHNRRCLYKRNQNTPHLRAPLVIGNFGHCTQELLNLLLVGQASSNVFDGSVPLGDSTAAASSDSVMLRGIPARAPVGYLTQVEALRYCQV